MKTNPATLIAFFFLLSFLTVSCRKDLYVLDSIFSKAQDCMDEHPDSALNLLKTIPYPENLHGKLQADYAILVTQAMDKNYMKFYSDSLITIGLNYYTVDQREPAMRAKAQFYNGRVLQELDRQEDALEYFLEAKVFYEGAKQYKMLALIAEEVGMINRIQKRYKDALSNFQLSLTLHERLKDSISIVRVYQNIARVFLYENKWDSCYLYYQKALGLAQQKKSKSEISILHELGILYRSMKNPKAESFFLAAYEKETDIEKKYVESLSLGYFYMQMYKIDKARKFLLQSTKASILATRRDAYRCLFRLEKYLSNYQLAIIYVEKADSINHVIREENSESAIADLQRKYDNEKLLNENLQMRMEYANAIAFGSFAFLVVIFFMCYFYYKNRNHKKRIAEIECTIKSNNEEIEHYQNGIIQLSDSKQQLVEENSSEIGELSGKILILTNQNKNLSEKLKHLKAEVRVRMTTEPALESKSYMQSLGFLLAIKEGTYKGNISNEDWESLLKLFDLLYWGYVRRLREKYPSLTKHDIEICCLLKLGLTNEDLSILFNTTSESVTRAKGRLKGRLGLTSRDDLEDFLHTF